MLLVVVVVAVQEGNQAVQLVRVWSSFSGTCNAVPVRAVVARDAVSVRMDVGLLIVLLVSCRVPIRYRRLVSHILLVRILVRHVPVGEGRERERWTRHGARWQSSSSRSSFKLGVRPERAETSRKQNTTTPLVSRLGNPALSARTRSRPSHSLAHARRGEADSNQTCREIITLWRTMVASSAGFCSAWSRSSPSGPSAPACSRTGSTA